MSWGVNLGLAGAAARGMNERQEQDNQNAFLEKTRDAHLKNLEMEDRLRPAREAATQGQLAYQTNYYKGATDNLGTQQENERLALSVNNATLRERSDTLARQRQRTEAIRAATNGAWSIAKERGLTPDQVPAILAENVTKALYDINEPVEAMQWQKISTSERYKQVWQANHELIAALSGGDYTRAAEIGTSVWSMLYPNKPAQLTPYYGAATAVAGAQPPQPVGWTLTVTENGKPKTSTLSPQQLIGLLRGAAQHFADPETLMKSEAETAKLLAVEQAKGDQARQTAAFEGKDWTKLKTSEHSESLVNVRTGQMIGGTGSAGASDVRPISEKESDQVHAQVAKLYGDPMSAMNPETKSQMSRVSSLAISLMQRGALDPKSRQPVGPLQAVDLALGVVNGTLDASKFEYGPQQPARGFGVSYLATPGSQAVQPQRDAQTGGAALPPLPAGMDPSAWKVGRDPSGAMVARQSGAATGGGYVYVAGQDGAAAWMQMDAEGRPVIGADGKPVTWKSSDAASAAKATPTPEGGEVKAMKPTTPNAIGEPVGNRGITLPEIDLPTAHRASRDEAINEARHLDNNIATLRTQIEGDRPGLNVEGAKKALTALEQKRAALNVSPEDIAAYDKRMDAEARARAEKVAATIRPKAPATASAMSPSTEPSAAPAPAEPRSAEVTTASFGVKAPAGPQPAAKSDLSTAAPPKPAKTSKATPTSEPVNERERQKRTLGTDGQKPTKPTASSVGPRPAGALEPLPKPEDITVFVDKSAPNSVATVTRKFIEQAPERLRRGDLKFFESYTKFLPIKERQRWVDAVNERIAKDGMNGLVPKTRRYAVSP